MDHVLIIPRKCCGEGETKEIHSKYNIESSTECHESENWVMISGFARKLVSLMRPVLELEIGPIDHWVNGFSKEDGDTYFVSFRSSKLSKNSLQYNGLGIK